MLNIFLLKDDFESLKCCLNLWLSSMLDCFHIFVFLFFEKLFLLISTASRHSRQLGYLSSSSVSFYHILNGFSIHQETFYMLDRCSIVGRSIEVGFCLIVARQLLDPSRFSCMHCFLHVLHLFIILFHYIHAFIWILCSPLIIFIFLEWSFLASCTLCQSWQKGGETVEKVWFFFLRFYIGGEIHAFVRGRCISSC